MAREITPSKHHKTMWRRHVFAYEHNAPDFPCLVKALEDMALHKRK